MQKYVFLLLLALPLFASAAPRLVDISIKNSQFQPAQLHIAAGEKIKLKIINQDDSAEEFESYELNREKLVAGNSSIYIFIGPLDAGEYPFFGEFHPDMARGVVIVE